MPRVTGSSPIFTTAVDVRHGVGAALDVGAAQEGPAVVADLLHPVQNQVGFSVRREGKTNSNSQLRHAEHSEYSRALG